MSKNVTIKEIAKELNISATAVSRALRDMPDISQETKQKVRLQADKMKYKKNQLASTLRTQRSNTVGFIMPDIDNPVFGNMYKGAESVCKSKGYTVIFSTTNDNGKDERQAIEAMMNHQIDGFIICPSLKNPDNIRLLKNSGIPFVTIGRDIYDENVCSVLAKDTTGGYEICRHLLSRGYKSFLYLTKEMTFPPAHDRYEGFCQCLAENKISSSALKVKECDLSFDSAYKAISEMSNDLKETRAIFAFNDVMAIGVLKYLNDYGYKVPEDIAVVGYDNIESCEFVSPSLTTVDLLGYTQGSEGMKLLFELINKGSVEDDKKHIIFSPNVVKRKSS